MLDFFRTVAQTIPSSSSSPVADTPTTETNIPGSARDMLQDRAGIIVLREDLDFYAIPPKAEIDQPEMIEVKRAAGRALLQQDGIFSGLRKSEEVGTTEQHLIEMLTAGGFYNDDRWGHRASEPNKAVICSLALARLRTDIKGNDLANSNAVGMAQKLLLFWRKPARRCWWEGVELDNVDGVEGKLKVWIRRVWTLEMTLDDLVRRKPSLLQQLSQLADASNTSPRAISPPLKALPRGTCTRTNPSTKRTSDGLRTWPHPEAKPVLDGLLPPQPGTLRRVPHMVDANHIPFLRFKKPQSPFLSHMIRKKTVERENRIIRQQILQQTLGWAADEDQWDKHVNAINGVFDDSDDKRWTDATRGVIAQLKAVQTRNITKRMAMAKRMFAILQQEKALAETERRDRRDQRHRAHKARRRAKEVATRDEDAHFDHEILAASSAAAGAM
ncbi:MAG: hypothetical protein Q9183_001487 [Haloplaca sp. 2 TL-2023]